MATKKRDYRPGSTPPAPDPADNPFAALSGLGASLPEGPPEGFTPEEEEGTGGSGNPYRNDRLRVTIDRKQRRGKVATIVTGYTGPEEALAELAKELKSKCGVGGAAKDGEIIIQGDKRKRVVEVLRERGFRDVKLSGG